MTTDMGKRFQSQSEISCEMVVTRLLLFSITKAGKSWRNSVNIFSHFFMNSILTVKCNWCKTNSPISRSLATSVPSSRVRYCWRENISSRCWSRRWVKWLRFRRFRLIFLLCFDIFVLAGFEKFIFSHLIL